MREPFAVVQVPSQRRVSDEQMGTKRKFWWRDTAERDWLFKYARDATGEHWAEKVAAEIAHLLDIPSAHVELATCDDLPGCNVLGFLPAGAGRPELVHGNELLQEVDVAYPAAKTRGVSKHTVDAVLKRLEDAAAPPEATASALVGGADWFVGYLLLDALIGNCDRHHENWAVLQSGSTPRRLAPSYDHASSLGRELRDEEREARLAGRDPRHSVQSYVDRAASAFFANATDRKPIHPVAAFRLAAQLRPSAGAFWLARLRAVGHNDLTEIVNALPASVAGPASQRFAVEALRITCHMLLGDQP